jgi:hypothetical protein
MLLTGGMFMLLPGGMVMLLNGVRRASIANSGSAAWRQASTGQ